VGLTRLLRPLLASLVTVPFCTAGDRGDRRRPFAVAHAAGPDMFLALAPGGIAEMAPTGKVLGAIR